MKNVFEIVTNLSVNKKADIKEHEDFNKLYVPFIVNKAFSYYLDTIMLANEMNKYPFLDKDMQYDFYFHSIKPRKRFSKWFKKDEEDQVTIQLIQEYYSCNETRAKEYLKLLDQEQLKYIQNKLNKGGR